MAMVDEGATHPRGEALLQELRWIHNIIRGNLDTIETLSAQILDGAPVEQIRAQIDDLASNSVVWRLRLHCLQYCFLVHTHHRLEDSAFFPWLRRANPELDALIDKLEADHAVVAGLLDEVESAANRLTDAPARPELAEALHALSEHLLAHLDYEEANLAPTLRRLRAWPPGV